MTTLRSAARPVQRRYNWMSTVYRMLHLDYHQPPWMCGVAAAVDEEEARRQARMFKDAGIQAVEIFAVDHYGHCFYPSEAGIIHPGLASDYTGLMAKALHAEGIKVILYLAVYTSVHLHAQHPDWFVRAADGSYPKGAWLQHEASHICASSPYLDAFFVPLLQEAVRRHDADAVWLDAGIWMIEALCYCDHCRRAFKDEMGYDLPQGTMPGPRDELDHPDWLAWRLWRRGQAYRYIATALTAAKAAKPDVLVADNNMGRFSTGVPEVAHGRLVRWLTPSELGVDYLSCDPVPFGGNHELILSRDARYQWTTGVPFNYMNERFHGWGEWQIRSATDWRLEAATVVANGGRAFFADQPYTEGTLEPMVYRALANVYAHVAAIEPCLRDADPVPSVAILASAPSQLLGPQGGAEWGRRAALSGHDDPLVQGDRADRVRGAHLLCVEGGIQALIYDEPTLRARLPDQEAVIVAEQCLLADATIDALRDYVQMGGTVLVTGRTGLWDEAGRRRDTDPLRDILGFERTGLLPAPVHYLRLNRQWRSMVGLPNVPLQLWGSAMAVARQGANELGTLYEPRAEAWQGGVRDEAHWQHYTVFGATPPSGTVAGAGVTLHRYGRGTALYLSVDPFALYYQEGHQLTRKLLLACLDRIAPADNRVLGVTKPLSVEVVLARQHGRTVIHVLNYAAQKSSGGRVRNEEIVPVHDIDIRIHTGAAPSQALLAPGGAALPVEVHGAWTSVRLPRLEVHAVIVLE